MPHKILSSKPTSLASAMARSQLRRCVPTHTRIATIKNQPRPLLPRAITNEKRNISNSSRLSYPRKDSQNRESINTDATEYSKSDTDDKAAQQDNVAFNPDLTDPQTQKKKASEKSHGQTDPLEVSPANHEVSKQREPTEGVASTGDKNRSSGGGSPSKGKKVS